MTNHLTQRLIAAASRWNHARCLELAHRDGPYWRTSRTRLDEAEGSLALAVAAYEDGFVAKVDELIASSSLGTPEAVAIRAAADPEVVKKTLRRADEIEAEAAYAQVVRDGKDTWEFDDYEECFKVGFLKARGHER